MKLRVIAETLVFAVVVAATAGLPSGCAGTVAAVSDDPFGRSLDTLARRKVTAEHWLQVSALTVGSGVAGATTFETITGASVLDPFVGRVGTIASFAILALGIVAGVSSFASYERAVDDYLETLRLQVRYENIVGSGVDAP